MILSEVDASAYWSSPEGIAQRIAMLSQSFTHKVVNNAIIIYGESGGITRWRWATNPGASRAGPCAYCESQNGRIYRKGQFLPSLPAHPYCLTPETEVNTYRGLVPIKDIKLGEYVLTHRGRYRQVTQLHKNPHEGKIYSLGGGWLTGNHPVLTPKGWTAIDRVEDGDQILSITFNGNCDLTPCNLDSDKLPTTASKEVFLSSIKPPLSFTRMPVSPVDFDGDSQLGDSEVQVVDVEGILWNNRDLGHLEDIEESGFKGGHRTSKLHLKGSSNPLLPRGFASSSSVVCTPDLDTSLFGGPLAPQELLRFTKTPNLNPRLDEASSDSIPRNSEMGGNLILGASAGVHFNDLFKGQLHLDEDPEVISHTWHKPITVTPIDSDTYKNYVYNLSVDEDESYTIGKQRIIVHNCVCTWELMFKPGEVPGYVA